MGSKVSDVNFLCLSFLIQKVGFSLTSTFLGVNLNIKCLAQGGAGCLEVLHKWCLEGGGESVLKPS
jgi:hypothetical protein